MNYPLTLPIDSDKSAQSTGQGSLNLDLVPPVRKNPKLENMRASLKNSLFNPERIHSTPLISTSNSITAVDEGRGTPTSDILDRSNGTPKSRNSNMERYRKLIKGNLFPQSNAKVINFFEKITENSDEYYPADQLKHSTSSIVLTPSNATCDDPRQESIGSFTYLIKEHSTPVSKVEESQHEDSLSIEVGENSHRSQSRGNVGSLMALHPIQSMDYVDSPSRDSDYRSNIFLRDVESEIEEIKKDLDVETDPNIHFIKGNFYLNYIEGEILGEGTSGTVKKCIRMSDGVAVAVKIVHYRDDLELLTLIVKEFKNQRRLNHKIIIKVYDLYVDYFKKKIYTVMELGECREMFDVLKDLGHYSEAVASGIFKQILAGINYLHTNGVCHRDLKPNNILVSEDGKIVKITDFNVSKFVENKIKKFSFLSKENYKMWTYTGTIAFTAPEVFDESEYTESVDMWSAGVVLYTMLCGYQPFQAEYVQDLIEKIKTGKYEFPADPWVNISKQAKNLVRRCLDVNYKTRCSPSEALMHPWIANCGKVSNTNIPRTLTYFNRFYRKNTLKRDRYPPKLNKSHKSNYICHPHSTKACDKCVSKGFDFSTDQEGAQESQSQTEEHRSNDSQQSINNLQPKRGKTGPEGVEIFRPNFLLKIEKSFSFSALEDPKYYGVREGAHQKYLEKDEAEDEGDGSDQDEPDTPSELERVYKQSVKPKANGEEVHKAKINDWLLDITNNSKMKAKQDDSLEKNDNSTEDESRKSSMKKEGKENDNIENESRQEKNNEKIWLEKNLYNEPLQMQE